MQLRKLLLIEDDLLSRINFCEKYKNLFQIDIARSKEEAKIKLKKNSYDLVFIDLDLDHELEGLKLIKHAKSKNLYTVILTARTDDEVIREAYFLGADDYLLKPIKLEAIEVILKKVNFKEESHLLLKKLTEKFSFEEELVIEIKTQLEKTLCDNEAILIRGSTGTGKTTLAKFIHEIQGGNIPFVHLNCAEFTENLLESELFGHVKGAFTGAVAEKAGLLELANGGILFLDEVGTLSMNMQKKLLKVLEDKEFKKVGGVNLLKSNFRLISATCDDLSEMIKASEFREDLFYRLNGHQFYMPSLSMSNIYLKNAIDKKLKSSTRKIFLTKEAESLLTNYSWPGNLRQLDKVINLLISNEKGIIEVNDIKKLIVENQNENKQSFDNEEKLISESGLNGYISKIEKQLVKKYLEKNNQKVRKTLQELKISNNTFYRILNNP